MVTGRVGPDGREAVIPLHLASQGRPGRSTEARAVIDTGFTDWLTLPPDVVEDPGIPVRGSVDVELADGSVERLPIHRVRVSWHGRMRLVRAPGGALVGMALLGGSRLTVDASEATGGAVRIEELP